jgi:hypothetical protein
VVARNSAARRIASSITLFGSWLLNYINSGGREQWFATYNLFYYVIWFLGYSTILTVVVKNSAARHIASFITLFGSWLLNYINCGGREQCCATYSLFHSNADLTFTRCFLLTLKRAWRPSRRIITVSTAVEAVPAAQGLMGICQRP